MRKRDAWRWGLGAWLLCAAIGSAFAHDFGGGTTGGGPPGGPPPGPDCNKTAGMCCNDPGTSKGDPISTFDGGQYLSYTDLSLGTAFPIQVVRHYDTRSEFDTALGYGWAFDHDRRLFKYPDGTVILRSGCGRRDRFVRTGGAFVTPRDAPQGVLTERGDGSFEYRYPAGNRDLFDADGRLVAIENREGQRHEFQYDSRGRLPLIGTSPRAVDPNSPMVVAHQPRLIRIQERGASGALTGYAVDFHYEEATGRLTHAIASDGRRVDYLHDELGNATRGNLIHVSGLENLEQTFTYAHPTNPHRLTGIQDGAGAATVVTTFDAQGRATRQTGGGSTLELAYPQPGTTVVTEIVTDAVGQELQRRTETFVFDEAGYLLKKIDAAGHELRHTYDAAKDRIRTEWWERQDDDSLTLLKATDYTYNGQAQKLTESVTLAGGETITKTWTYDHGWIASEQVQSSSDPQVFRTEYDFTRDGQGQPVNIAAVKRRNDDGTFSITTYTYCSTSEASAVNSDCPDTALVKTIDGPRVDVADVTSYEYYGTTQTSGCATDGPCHRRGDLRKTVNALGHATEILRYDNGGRPTRVRDAKGIVTEFSYHPRGWLLERAVRGPDGATSADDAITRFAYDPRGNLTQTEQPDGSVLEFEYDAHNRLIEIRDSDGGRLRYTLDSQGNRLKEEVIDASNTLHRTLARTYDVLDRIATQVGAQGQTTQLTYDGAGRQSRLTDPLGTETHQAYDALDRMTRTVSDAADGGHQATMQYAYDAIGNLRQVIDPKGLATTYTYSARGDLLQLDSPDTGITAYTYDAAGNRAGQVDARGQASTYAYDPLGRLSSITYEGAAALNVTYGYDQPDGETGCVDSFPIGQLTTMTDGSGSTTYCYDHRGNPIRKVQLTQGAELVTAYAYDLADRLVQVAYPDATVVDYVRDTQGRITEVGVATPGDPREVLLTDAGYVPFGQNADWTYGNGRQLIRRYDQDGRPQAIQDSGDGLDLGYGFDDAGNITALHTADLTTPPMAAFAYDPLSRLIGMSDAANAPLYGYTYDATGNRTSLSEAGATQAYHYPADSHRLVTVGSTARTYDAGGNTTSIGGTAREFVYDATNRMAQVKRNGAVRADYKYNGKGEQVRRVVDGTVTHFVYNEAGQLLGQYRPSGVPLQQYVWLDDLPVGVIVNGKLHYVQPDHLGTPRVVVDPVRDVAVWSWDLEAEAFGNRAPEIDPDGDGTTFVFDLRFPGQRYDAASGLNYNYFRDYEPGTGRYAQSDPIGLKGGISTYGYGHMSPLTFIDLKGLQPITCSNLRGAIGTIQCDGRGGYEVVNCDQSCTRRCTQMHEQQHIQDWIRRYGANSCRGRARGDLPSDDTSAYSDLMPYDSFRAMTECRAWRVSKSCAQGIKNGENCSSNCTSEADSLISQADRWIAYYHCAGYGW